MFKLTVELIPTENGSAYPDLFYVGLTDVCGMIKHFEDVWRLSGLSSWFRCRWRIEFNDDGRQSTEEIKNEDRYIRSLTGDSAQAACLVAILAASGDPYQLKTINSIKDFPSPEEIALDVAISAAVDCIGNANRPVRERSLAKVGKVPQKLEKTRSVLDFLALFDGEEKTPEIGELKVKRENFDNQTYDEKKDKPVGIQFASTVENALDLLLESNQYQTAYRNEIRAAWLKQWEVNTGRFPGESEAVAGDPDFDNRPEDKLDSAQANQAEHKG